MAVVYADLRFSRARGQDPGVTGEREDENCDITYENVTNRKPRDQTQSARTCPRDFRTLPPYVTITLLLLSCSLMVVVIGLSVRFSQVSKLQLNTEAELQQLQGKHEELSSRFTQDNLRKDSLIETLKENQRQSQQKLEKTLSSLQQVQNKWKTTTEEMGRTAREKENTETALRRQQDVLQSTKTQLEAKQVELSRCQDDLRLKDTQKKTSDNALTQTRSILYITQTRLQQRESALSSKDKELSNVKKSLQEVKKILEDKKRYSEEQEKSLQDLNARQSDATKCLSRAENNTSDTIDYCPPGWHQVGERCYYFSTQKNFRSSAFSDCEDRSATLAKVDDELPTLTDRIRKNSRNYWIGLKKNKSSWEWPDGSILKGFQLMGSQMCVKASPVLSPEPCSTKLPWICEMRTKTSSSNMEVLRCMGERIGLFGESHLEQ